MQTHRGEHWTGAIDPSGHVAACVAVKASPRGQLYRAALPHSAVVEKVIQASATEDADAYSPNCIATILDEPSTLSLDEQKHPIRRMIDAWDLNQSDPSSQTDALALPRRAAMRGTQKGEAIAILIEGRNIYALAFAVFLLIVAVGMPTALSLVPLHHFGWSTISSMSPPGLAATRLEGLVHMPTWAPWPMVLSPWPVVQSPFWGDGSCKAVPAPPSRRADPIDVMMDLLDYEGFSFGEMGLFGTQPWLAWHVGNGNTAHSQPNPLRSSPTHATRVKSADAVQDVADQPPPMSHWQDVARLAFGTILTGYGLPLVLQ